MKRDSDGRWATLERKARHPRDSSQKDPPGFGVEPFEVCVEGSEVVEDVVNGDTLSLLHFSRSAPSLLLASFAISFAREHSVVSKDFQHKLIHSL